MKVAEITILDGGIGHLFKSKGVEQLCEGLAYDELFAAGSLANVLRPELVREVHEQYVQAGADVIEANNFSCTRWSLDKIGRADHALELAVAGAKIAREVATASGRRVSVAGSLPPLEESYQVYSPSECQAMEQEYIQMATALAPHVDIFLCETMTSIAQAQAAAHAASNVSEKPIWVSFTLQDNTQGLLRGGERVEDAVQAMVDIPSVHAVLFNCCAPPTITASLRAVKSAKLPHTMRIGAYANGFKTTTSQWLAQGGNGGSSALISLPEQEYDDDGIIKPDAYLKHAQKWVENGASIIGGCCGVGPDHIAEISKLHG